MAHRHVRRVDQSWPSALFALFSYYGQDVFPREM